MKLKEFELVVRLRNNLLKERRDQLGYTQADMALAIGITLPQYATLECLSRSPVDDNGEWTSFALKIAEYFDCEPSELFPDSIMKVTAPTAVRKFDGAELPLLMSGYNQASADGSEQGLLSAAEATDEQYVFRKSMLRLRPLEADIMQSNLGVGLKQPETLNEIANRHHLSRERVRQLKEQALGKVRKDMFHRMGDSKIFQVILAGPFKPGELNRLVDLISDSLKFIHPEAVVKVVADYEAKQKVTVRAYGFMGEGYEIIEKAAEKSVKELWKAGAWRKETL